MRVKPNARKEEVRQTGERELVVSVAAPPVDGKANDRLIELLAEYFGKPKRSIAVLRGASSRLKVIEIA